MELQDAVRTHGDRFESISKLTIEVCEDELSSL